MFSINKSNRTTIYRHNWNLSISRDDIRNIIKLFGYIYNASMYKSGKFKEKYITFTLYIWTVHQTSMSLQNDMKLRKFWSLHNHNNSLLDGVSLVDIRIKIKFVESFIYVSLILYWRETILQFCFLKWQPKYYLSLH